MCILYFHVIKRKYHTRVSVFLCVGLVGLQLQNEIVSSASELQVIAPVTFSLVKVIVIKSFIL